VVHGDGGVAWHGNNDQLQGTASVEGAFGGFGWRLGLVARDAGDIDTPDGELENTDYEQINADAAVGLSGTWGSAQLRWNHWDNNVGFYFPAGNPSNGFRLDLEDDFLAAEATLPTAVGDVGLLLSRQENRRKAFNPAAPVYPEAAVDLNLETVVARASFAHTPLGAFQGTVAAELQTVENQTYASFLLPDYDSRNASVMILEEGRFLTANEGGFERLIISAGLRWDDSELDVPVSPGHPVVPEGFNKDYSHVTGSLGLVFRATEQLSLAANLGRGWRPPNAFELFARGVHGGIAAFQMGNPDLEEESNLSSELSVKYLSAHWRVVVTGFCSDFDDYIYLYDTGETIDELPIFGFGQTDAVLDGIEASVELVPLEQLKLGLVYSSVNTENDATGKPLPQSPPDRFNLTVRGMTGTIGRLLSPYVELEGVWIDDGVPSGPDEPFYATGNAATENYTLVHLRAGFRLPVAAGALRLDLTVRNLFDKAYTDFLYPYKAFGVLNPGRDIRLIAGYSF
jgi:iron complex outermembrane receptor protein/hemoglobin/transferrin/lactoferrin receptor protein